jgi:hypothetical protein
VHGVSKHYDLPDLIEMIGRQRVVVEETVDVMGNVVSR